MKSNRHPEPGTETILLFEIMRKKRSVFAGKLQQTRAWVTSVPGLKRPLNRRDIFRQGWGMHEEQGNGTAACTNKKGQVAGSQITYNAAGQKQKN